MNEQLAIEKMQFLIDAYIELAKQEKVEITLLSGCISIKGEGNFATETYIELIRACLMAKDALEKQLYTNPTERTVYNMPNYECPVCNGQLYRGQLYCDECGKKIDWSIENG